MHPHMFDSKEKSNLLHYYLPLGAVIGLVGSIIIPYISREGITTDSGYNALDAGYSSKIVRGIEENNKFSQETDNLDNFLEDTRIETLMVMGKDVQTNRELGQCDANYSLGLEKCGEKAQKDLTKKCSSSLYNNHGAWESCYINVKGLEEKCQEPYRQKHDECFDTVMDRNLKRLKKEERKKSIKNAQDLLDKTLK